MFFISKIAHTKKSRNKNILNNITWNKIPYFCLFFHSSYIYDTNVLRWCSSVAWLNKKSQKVCFAFGCSSTVFIPFGCETIIQATISATLRSSNWFGFSIPACDLDHQIEIQHNWWFMRVITKDDIGFDFWILLCAQALTHRYSCAHARAPAQ